MPIPPEREVYRSSGLLNLGRFLPLYCLTLLISVLVGGLLCVAWHTGTFFTILIPAFGGLAVSGMVFVTVHTGHCRSALVGVVAGAIAGCVAFFGAYQVDLAYTAGWENLWRIDLLPDHINYRIKNDGVIVVGRFQPNSPSQNLTELLINATATVLIPLVAGWRIARRPFCEIRGQWLDKFTFALSCASADAVMEALRDGDPAALRSAITSADHEATAYVTAEVLYVPRSAESSAYLTLTHVKLTPKGRELVDQSIVANRWLLTADEAAVVATAFRISDAGFASQERVHAAGEPVPIDAAGLVVDLGPNPVFNERARAVVGAMIHVPVGCCIVLGLGSFFAGVAAHYLVPGLALWASAATLAGGFGFLFLGIVVARFINVLPSRYLFARLCREIATRPDAIVRPGDPGAVFVEVVPRRNWVPKDGENADDFGLLRVDEERGLLLFEGGAERWAVPAAAVLGCEVIEYCAHPQTGEAANIPVLVLTANVGGVVWERPLCLRSMECRPQSVDTRREAMERLEGYLHRVIPV
jgi:hypothetical protein